MILRTIQDVVMILAFIVLTLYIRKGFKKFVSRAIFTVFMIAIIIVAILITFSPLALWF